MGKTSAGRRVTAHRWKQTACVALVTFASTCAIADASAPGKPFLSSFEQGDATPLSARGKGWEARVVSGPTKEEVLTAAANVGFTGTHALRYEAGAGKQGQRRLTLYKLKQSVTPGTHLSYLIFPVRPGESPGDAAQYVAVDLLF